MTRKRKVDNSADDSNNEKKDRLAEYGYQSAPDEPSPSTGDFHQQRTFPQKARHGNFRERGGHSNRGFRGRGGRHFGGGDFSRNHENHDTHETMMNSNVPEGESGGGREDKEAYPSELVAYLKNIEQMKLAEGHIEDIVLEKCTEECSGEEEKLLSFRDSCIVVESVFGSSQYGATLFLSGLARLKHKRLLDLFFSGISARTIETLFYALHPVSSNQQVQLVEKFAELLCDNWNDAVGCQHSSFLIRCLARVACGLPRKGKEKEAQPPQLKSKGNEDVKTSLSRVFERIALLALDSASSPAVENVHLSLVIQDVLEADTLAKLGKSATLVEKTLEKSDEGGENLRRLWQGKNSSRVWEKLVAACREETLQSLWETAVTGHVSELASHPCANFPLQKFISTVKSLELATDVCHEATPLLSTFLSKNRWGVAAALLRCAARHEELQEPLLKEMRKYFKAEKASNKLNFFYNVITLNSYNGKAFNVQQCDLQGCLLMEVLLSFKKVKTSSACLEALPPGEIMQLAKNNRASHVLQAAFKSATLADNVKEKLIAAFEADWESLISDVYGSHVFETIWDCSLFNVKRRQDLLKKLVPIHNDSKFWKFAMLRCDMYLFRKDRKAWVQKMKQSVKGSKQ
ncbi:RNA binding repeat protein, Pumilio-family [Ancylostoma caninum]|uniref:RNA binding repeat protein, Pumilio-family n=1 Tax=Ancylostoma caninum TaxID=29170 RepID=A0A368HA40_ANCCA|nr:RNA binding repeat protein, Pumilio-family [Ancylostoma caninum]